MRKAFALLVCAILVGFMTMAQDSKKYQNFGDIDRSDLEMKFCEYEKAANAMVLFNKADLYYDDKFNIILEHHKRIKIFNDAGKDQANIRIEFYEGNRYEYLSNIKAQIFNLENGKVETIKLDKKQFYTEKIDKNKSALIFSFPNVRSGSVIEYKYTQNINTMVYVPAWFFQEEIPVRHSEYITEIPEWFTFSVQQRNFDKLLTRETSTESKSMDVSQSTPILYKVNVTKYSLDNVPSIVKEPLMTSEVDNLHSIYFQLTNFAPPYGFVKNISESWAKVGGILAEDDDFGKQLNKKLKGSEELVAKAKELKTDDEKISFLFSEVKKIMKWNGVDRWYTNEGVVDAWQAKTGNSTEVNLILYRLLDLSGVASIPMIVSTRDHGKINTSCTFLYQFNRAVVFVPKKGKDEYYILDAADPNNSYNNIPTSILGSWGLWMDKENKKYDLVPINSNLSSLHSVFVNASIMPEGKLKGNATIKNSGYARNTVVTRFKEKGEAACQEYLKQKDNSLSITNLELSNVESDTLPVTQKIEFTMDLAGADDQYVYLNANLFSSLDKNPFLNEERHSSVQFDYKKDYDMYNVLTVPAGYSVESAPKSTTIIMPDTSIIFRRNVDVADGLILVKYTINHKKQLYTQNEYKDLYVFYQKMYELLNEQFVIKKS